MTEDRVALTERLLAEDALIFGLRMNRGVDLATWQQRCPDAPWAEFKARLDRLAAEGLLEREDSRVRLTHPGRLVADAVGAGLLNSAA
jgi:oxygen-independent coproporphyrinogen-3 oxidase